MVHSGFSYRSYTKHTINQGAVHQSQTQTRYGTVGFFKRSNLAWHESAFFIYDDDDNEKKNDRASNETENRI